MVGRKFSGSFLTFHSILSGGCRQEFINAAMKYCGSTTVGRVVPNAPRFAATSRAA